MKKFRFAMALMVVLAMALTACSGSKQEPKKEDPAKPAAPAEPTTTLHYLMTTKPTTFDPALTSDAPTMQMIQNVYAGLVSANEKGEVVPDMAAKIDVSADGKVYTFTLKDAKFHDGTKVTAEDFKRSFLRAMNPGIGATLADTYLDDIPGYAKFLAKQGEIAKAVKDKTMTEDASKAEIAKAYEALKADSGIVAKDEKTLVITLNEAIPYFLAKLTYPTGFVVGKSVPSDKGLDASPASAKLMNGTGAFKMDSYVEGSKIVIKRFADYFGDKAKVGTVEFAVIETDQAQLAAYRSGQLDISPIPPNDYKTLKADATLSKDIREWAAARIQYFALNQKVWEPAKDVRVRQAFNYAVDKDKMNDVVFGGVHQPAYGYLPDSIPGALGSKAQMLKFDPAKAKALLKEAGYGEGGKPLTLKVTYRAKNETAQRLAEFLQNQFQTNLANIKITIEPMDWSALLTASKAKNQLQAFALGWGADYMDPQNFLGVLLHGKAPENRVGWLNKDFDTILEKADKMPNGPARFAEYSKAEQIAINDSPWVPLYYQKQLWLVRPTVKGLWWNAMGIQQLNKVEITK